MKDDETFDAFYAKLNDIVNSRFNLGDRIPENRVVRKVLRSLPERFRPKVTAIEESKDVDAMRIEELAKERAKIASLSENESESSDSSGNSSPKQNLNYMAFTVSVDSKSQHSENVSDDESKSRNEFEYEDELQEVYEKLYKECVKLRKLNKVHIEELDFIKRENEELQGKLTEAIVLADQFKMKKVFLEDELKTHESEITLLKEKLKSFSSRKQKLDEILNFGKSPSNKSGLGYDAVKFEAASTSKRILTHMSGDRSLFKTVEEYKCGTVTFGDGGKADIIGRGEIDIPGLPVLREVLFVDRLKANLLSISQMCDNGAEVHFSKEKCIVSDNDGNCMMQGTRTSDNCYDITPNFQYSCNSAKSEAIDLWHQRLGHVNHKNLSKIARKEMVIGLPELGKVETLVCGSCQLGKQVRIARKKTTDILTGQSLELLHIDLMGPSRTESLGGKRYILVMVDDFTRYSWVGFLREKAEAPNVIKILCKKLQNEQGKVIVRIRSDHGREFDNSNLESFYDEEGISQEFSAPITSQQNGVVERKNRVIQEMARVMIHSKNVPTHFWGEAVNTACHIVNRVYPRPNTSKTPYELWKGKKPNVKYFRVFGSKCYILRNRENLAKFDPKSDEGIFLKYSRNNCTYRCYNLHTRSVIESITVVVNDAPEEKLNKDESSHLPSETEREDGDAVRENLESSSNEKVRSQKEPSSRVKLNHPQENIIGNIDEGIRLRRKVVNQLAHSSYISQIEPKRVEEGLNDENWLNVMHDEINQFVRNNVWLKKALYGLKQAPRAWYERLTSYLENYKFLRGDLITKFGLDGKSHARTPTSTSVKLSADLSGKDVEQSLYRSMIGSLLYLTASRPDIAFSVGLTIGFCILETLTLNLQVIQMLIEQMKQMLCDYGIAQGVMSVYCDNTSAINISKNPVQHSRTKHIDIRHHLIQELVETKVVILEYVSTEHQLADLFTKPLDGLRFELLRKAIGICALT
ncbi:uncharacterized protein LOC122278499 [Carya illinoinensis]|uniref:uncharacterized protein LOC122278499 n=1 Tax=Carya illinoinensis TaxID=32201 RepID=UPI001C718580|nr:uncharacterized protein LOC122278499 [Carya illinoinensis]